MESRAEYLYTYKEYSICQDMENGHFIAFDPDGELTFNEATQEMVKNKIDNVSNRVIKP